MITASFDDGPFEHVMDLRRKIKAAKTDTAATADPTASGAIMNEELFEGI